MNVDALSGSSSDDEMSSMSEDEQEIAEQPEDVVKVTDPEYWQRKDQLRDNPTYTNYVKWIEALRSRDGVYAQSLRKARQEFSSKYPMQQDLWKQWRDDEERIRQKGNKKVERLSKDETAAAMSTEDLMNLYQKWCDEYVHVYSLEEFFSFAMRMYLENEMDANIVRTVGEYCLEKGGAVFGAANLWESVRTFAQMQLETLEEMDEVDDNVVQEAENYVRTLYIRQLRIPLEGIHKIYQEYCNWEQSKNGTISAEVKDAYHAAQRKLSQIQPFEKSVKDSSKENSIANWTAYIKFQLDEFYGKHPKKKKGPKKGKDKEEIQDDELISPPKLRRSILLLERAVAAHCLEVSFWSTFVSFVLEQTIKGDIEVKFAKHTCERAVKHRPQSGLLWVYNIQALELGCATMSEIDEVANVALSSGLFSMEDIYLVVFAHCTAHRRNYSGREDEEDDKYPGIGSMDDEKKDAFGKLIRESTELFAVYARDLPEYAVELVKFHGKTFAKSDGMRAISIFRESLKARAFARLPDLWLELLELQIQENDEIKAIRSTFSRACDSVKFNSHLIYNRWIQFEATNGTIVDQIKAESHIKRRKEELAESSRGKLAAIPQKETPSSKNNNQREDPKDDKTKEQPQEKRKRSEKEESVPNEEDLKKRKTESTADEARHGKNPIPPENVSENSSQTAVIDENVSEKSSQPSVTHESVSEKSSQPHVISIFGLPFDYNEEEIKGLLSPFGEVIKFHQLLDSEGKYHGQLEAEFANPEQAHDAVNELKRKEYKGSTLSVRLKKPKFESWREGHKHDENSYKRTVLITNLYPKIRDSDVKEMFKECGEIVSVRLPMNRGLSKGFGYVEFGNEDSVPKAIQLTGIPCGPRRLKVVQCDPNKSKSRERDTANTPERSRIAHPSENNSYSYNSASNNNNNTSVGGARRLMVPTALRRQTLSVNASALSGAAPVPAASPAPPSSDAPPSAAPPESGMNNRDFRALFLKK